MPRGVVPFHSSGTAAAGGTGSTGFGTVVEFVRTRSYTRLINDTEAAVDVGGGLVGIPITAHELSVGDEVVITLTVNYNGNFVVKGTSPDQIDITATYVAENFGANDTLVKVKKRAFLSKDVSVKSVAGEALYFSFDNRQTWTKLDIGHSWSGDVRAHSVIVGSVGAAGTYEIAASLI